MELQASAVFGLAGVPVVMALVEVVKRTLAPPSRWVPLVSLVIGLVFNGVVGVGLLEVSLGVALLNGLIVGLAASGLYSAQRTVRSTEE